MPRRRRVFEFFGVNTDRDGKPVGIWIRTSPEDIEHYDFDDGIPEVLKRLRRWDSDLEHTLDTVHELEETARILQDQLAEGVKELRPLLDDGTLDESDLGDLQEYLHE